MANTDTYPIAAQIALACQALNISVDRVLCRAGLPADFASMGQRSATAAQFFAIWKAVEDEAERPDLALFLGQVMARGPMLPAIFGFASSPDIETGFARLAVFKPLVAPIRLSAERDAHGLSLRWHTPPGISVTPAFAFFELVYFLELCRGFTGEQIIPLAIGAPSGNSVGDALHDFFGLRPHIAPVAEMRLSAADAQRPMIFANEVQYRVLEADLQRQLKRRTRGRPLTTRVRRTLVDVLPAGAASVDVVCGRLAMSRRTLQRKLSAEGETFQTVLETTRADLAAHYLKRGDMSIQEISFLLAYRDPNSFYRAFQGWTGMTPGQARAQHS